MIRQRVDTAKAMISGLDHLPNGNPAAENVL
jgi:hypothetical protein